MGHWRVCRSDCRRLVDVRRTGVAAVARKGASRTTSRIYALQLMVLGMSLTCGGCRAARWPPQPPSDVPVEVRLTTLARVPRPLLVYLVAEGGSRQFIGTAREGPVRTFAVDLGGATGRYRLSARTPNGWSLTSAAFLLDAGDTVVWNVPSNVLAVVNHARR